MKFSSFINVIKSCVQPKRFPIIYGKVQRRIFKFNDSLSKKENLSWIKRNCVAFSPLAENLDAKLMAETNKIVQTIKHDAQEILDPLPFKLGGGGAYDVLYFITRYLQPDTIVETGVAAGYSSQAFLQAIKENGKGHLYSSDFPYFRLSNSENFIGIIVNKSLKENWSLYIDGDESNLPTILNQLNGKTIDIFHYDSDKSFSGRKKAMAMVSSHLTDSSIIIMDDIQDNSFFYQYIKDKSPKYWYIFEFGGKYVGVVGSIFKK